MARVTLQVFFVLFLSLLPLASALGQNATVGFSSAAGSVLLGSSAKAVQVIVDSADWKGVKKAASDLAQDFGRVTGVNGSAISAVGSGGTNLTVTGGVVIAGTIGKSAIIDGLVNSGKIDVSAIKDHWEAFTSLIVSSPLPGIDKALVIAGTDKRGTIYGLYDVSEQIGVSPWYWWADVPSKKHDAVYALDTKKVQGSPSVRYRGIFLNDEAPAMTGWVNAKYPPAKYGPGYNADLYTTIFELLLRLRANYIWPAGADWGQTFFVDDPRNQPLADEMGIVMGTSHTEPMVRATKEWNLFGTGPWQWNLNNNSIIPFMKEGVERAKPYESVITMGMRGSGDTALGPTIQTELLENIVETERKIIAEVYGAENVTKVPQMWCLYKEVQGFYEAGMRVPDDITLLWADDNWGNVRRLPLPGERNRTGGAGVYFHFDYVGDPRDYKWVNTIQLQKTWEQMNLAYQRNARQIWVVNVGDLKPLEIPMSHFLDLAYDFEKWGADSTLSWMKLWSAREYGPEKADDIADVLNTYSMLAGRRKFELLEPSIYSVINYEEADKVLAAWNALASKAQVISDSLSADTQPAFFETILHPVLGGAAVYDIHISSAKNQLAAGQGRNSANTLIQHMLSRLKDDHELTVKYNTLLNGKWEHMMDQTHLGYVYWQQPMRQVTPPVQYVQTLERSLRGDMAISTEGTNASVPGDDVYHSLSSNTLTMIPIDPYATAKRYIDIFNVGTNTFTWNIATAASHVKFSASTGSISPDGPDARIYVTVDWASAPAGASVAVINVTSSQDYGAQFRMPSLNLPINNTAIPKDFAAGFVESDLTVSIEAEHYQRVSGNSSAVQYTKIPNYGKTLSGITLLPATAPSQTAPGSPALEYDFYTFSSISKAANITSIFGTGLNSDPTRPLKYAIAIDSGAPQTVQYITDQTGGNLPVNWGGAVANAAWTSTISATIAPGKHTLKFWALEPAVVLQKLVIDLGGVRASYLGPPESYLVK